MTKGETAPAANPPHYLGHRERLRDRFRKGGADALGEYELLELILFRAMPRRDVKPLAKALIARFGSFAEVVSAQHLRLRVATPLGDAGPAEVKPNRGPGRRRGRRVKHYRGGGQESRQVRFRKAAVAVEFRGGFRFLPHRWF